MERPGGFNAGVTGIYGVYSGGVRAPCRQRVDTGQTPM